MGMNSCYTIEDLPLDDKQKERVLEWFAYKIWSAMVELDVLEDYYKRYDPLTIKDGTAHSYVFDLEDGGRHHTFRDYNHLEEMLCLELTQAVKHFLEGGLRTALATSTLTADELRYIADKIDTEGRSK